MSPRKLQALVLRSTGTVECFAFAAVVIPFRWMGLVHAWLGLGAMPEGAVLRYLIREVSLLAGLHGVLLWLLARDVERFRPLVIFTGFSYLLGGPVFALGAATAGMPWFWFLGEGLSCLAVGIIVLSLAVLGDHGAGRTHSP
jgi:hypothetical protein